MGAYLSIHVGYRSYNKDSNIVKELHELYRKYGMKLDYIYCKKDENISYEDACNSNQKCFDSLINFEEWKHYRMCWSCDWISYIDTTPCINIILPNYDGNGRPYNVKKEELILFPEEEITDKVFSKILDLVKDLYNLDSVYSVKIEKETY